MFFLIFESILVMFWLLKYVQIMYFKSEEPISFMFLLQNRYKSGIFKPKNRLGPEPESTMGYTGFLKIY